MPQAFVSCKHAAGNDGGDSADGGVTEMLLSHQRVTYQDKSWFGNFAVGTGCAELPGDARLSLPPRGASVPGEDWVAAQSHGVNDSREFPPSPRRAGYRNKSWIRDDWGKAPSASIQPNQEQLSGAALSGSASDPTVAASFLKPIC